MKKIYIISGVVVLIIGLIVFNEATKKPVMAEKMLLGEGCKLENDRKRVTIDGYVKIGNSVLCSSTCNLSFVAKPSQNDSNTGLSISVGNGRNHMKKLEKDFKKSDLSIQDKNNQVVGDNGAARFTGKLSAFKSEGKVRCTLMVEEVEKVAESDLVLPKIAEALPVDHNSICTDQYEDKNVVIEGYIGLPSTYLGTFPTLKATLRPLGSSDAKDLEFQLELGKEANQVEPTKKAIVGFDGPSSLVHDKNGKALDLSKPVKAYGVKTSATLNGQKSCEFKLEYLEQK